MSYSAKTRNAARVLFVEGASAYEVADQLGISRDTTTRWKKQDRRFLPADIKGARLKAELRRELMAGRVSLDVQIMACGARLVLRKGILCVAVLGEERAGAWDLTLAGCKAASLARVLPQLIQRAQVRQQGVGGGAGHVREMARERFPVKQDVLVAALGVIRKQRCAYTRPPCDCKFGIVDGPRLHGEHGNGCPELYFAKDLIAAMTPAEYARIMKRTARVTYDAPTPAPSAKPRARRP